MSLSSLPSELFSKYYPSTMAEIYSIQFDASSLQYLNNTSMEFKHHCPNGIANARLGTLSAYTFTNDRFLATSAQHGPVETTLLRFPMISLRLFGDRLIIGIHLSFILRSTVLNQQKYIYGPTELEFNLQLYHKLVLNMPSIASTVVGTVFTVKETKKESQAFTPEGYSTLFSLGLVGGETSKATLRYTFSSLVILDALGSYVMFKPRYSNQLWTFLRYSSLSWRKSISCQNASHFDCEN
ncbi:predicted protein [Naegleria gruberi]|uniref:Predicted protein n=1 Tax=Naegleria gruberi TaxID=5762 RepID=D2VKJ0_NAEGR|nr:uncharacterized protein NAEGRDRAFT_69410 [Naegleria gruberi]EFC42603.1 predicted protein [Naegleria gruberi]|eukprot:XP_002675347.1 predicted protein [Naegleria gruberi strain NEG-M]